MNCPKCTYPNPAGAKYCQLCYEVFNRSAADRYLHAQRRAQRQDHPDADSGDPAAFTVTPMHPVRDLMAQVNWTGFVSKVLASVRGFFQTYLKYIGMAVGIVALGVALVFFTSAKQRLQIFGSRLEYRFSQSQPVPYSVGFHTELKSWSERGGRLDTPLGTVECNEIGNVTARGDVPRNKLQQVTFQPTEWILSQSGQVSQVIPLSHPSLKPVGILLNARGRIQNRVNPGSARMGRVLTFLAPRWPAGSQRTRAHWEEPVEWVESVGPWKILWKGKLRWMVAGVEQWHDASYLRLTYTADVKTSVWESPEWMHGGVRSVAFQGKSFGNARFDQTQHHLVSNDFVQEGTLTLFVDNIYRIPAELRVGRTPRHHWGEAPTPEPGQIFLQLKSRLGIHKS